MINEAKAAFCAELSMTTVYRSDLIRIQSMRRKVGDETSQALISRALNMLEIALKAGE